ncbi:MAG TPA: hypothetical protein IAA59_09105 [Candidatus Faecaligallichristensenella faecipullorum]|nr:hypothetical protein [Candidatus Faecaligallichristensenella faecipullorum]
MFYAMENGGRAMQDDENTPEMRLRFMKIREAPGLSARCRGKWGYPILLRKT